MNSVPHGSRPAAVMAPAPPPESGALLVRARPEPAARMRLVCFPHSGAGPAAFRRWAQRLAPGIEVWSAVLPGRATRTGEPFANRWEPLVEEFATAVTAAVPGPYALFGQSLGAMLAFEVARELGRRGGGPVHLVAAASAAPDVRETPPIPSDDTALVEEIDRRYDGIPAEVRAVPELVTYFLPVLRADLELAASYVYRPGPPLDVPVTVFAGDRDGTVPAAGLERWRGHTGADCESHRLTGGHFAVTDHEDHVLDVIRRRLSG
ncbi:thioesterase domain-containing protein [Streptomyces sp. NPDC051987]|uniref:thioesterase II family protein n=1 Tax=Streptomyces sp. NPDC051987 TaxID=3155808 RepID=UPI00341D0063